MDLLSRFLAHRARTRVDEPNEWERQRNEPSRSCYDISCEKQKKRDPLLYKSGRDVHVYTAPLRPSQLDDLKRRLRFSTTPRFSPCSLFCLVCQPLPTRLLLAPIGSLPTEIKGDVPVLDHVPVSERKNDRTVNQPPRLPTAMTCVSLGPSENALNLPPHGQPKEGEKVDQQDGPIDGDIRRPRRRRQQRQQGGLGGREPEFELGQSTDERSEFLFVPVVVAAVAVVRRETVHQPLETWVRRKEID